MVLAFDEGSTMAWVVNLAEPFLVYLVAHRGVNLVFENHRKVSLHDFGLLLRDLLRIGDLKKAL
jgi:hypothetical protein